MKKSPGVIAALTALFLLALVAVGMGTVLKITRRNRLQNMQGIDDGDEVVWKGRKVGAISARSMSRGVHGLELALDPNVFNTVHYDAEIRIDRTHGVLVLTGGDRRSEPFLKKGSEINPEKETLSKQSRLARSAIEESEDRLLGFWGGLCAPRKKCPELEEIAVVTKNSKRSNAQNQEPDVFVGGSLEGIDVDAPVEWNGARIGRVVKLGFQDRRQKADILWDNGHRGRLHADASIQIEQSPSGRIRISGGDDARQSVLAGGNRMPVQSAGDEGGLVDARLMSFFHSVTDGLEELWMSINDKSFLKDIEVSNGYAAMNRHEVY